MKQPMRYLEYKPINRSKAKAMLQMGAEEIKEALLRLALHDEDWVWVETLCLSFLDHPDLDVKKIAIQSLGHLARIHKCLHLELILPKLNTMSHIRELRAAVDDVLDDIKIFIKA
jgi:hypothetical protein